MKKLIARLLIAVSAIVLCTAPAAAEFRYGPVAGVNINSLKFNQKLFPHDHSVAAQAGITGELMFPGIGFGLDLSLLYNQMGGKVDLGAREIWKVDGFTSYSLILHTIQLPLHLRFKWTRMQGVEDYIAPFAYGGPDFAINVAHSAVKGNAGVANPFKYTAGDIGLTVGGGFELFRRCQLSAQYTWGIMDMLHTRKLDNVNAKNRQLSIRAAWLF